MYRDYLGTERRGEERRIPGSRAWQKSVLF